MADENLQTEEVKQEVEASPAELQAREQGWVPKDEYQGEEHKWVDAGEFLRRGELFKKIEDQSKQLKDVKKALADMAKLNADIREHEYGRALAALKEQKKTALADGDADALIDIDEKIAAVREEQRELKAAPTPQVGDSGEAHPEFQQWVAQNQWYATNAPMKAFADRLGQELQASGNSPSEVLRKVAQAVREEFPKRFHNPNRDKPGGVESSGVKSGVKTKDNFQLTDDERRTMQRFIRSGAPITEAEYIEQLKKMRG
jgi:hypothetical protein